MNSFDITKLDCTIDELVGGIIEHLGMPCLLQSAARVVEGNTPPVATQRPGTKLAVIEQMLLRPEGVTSAELREALGWPTITMTGQARSMGITLTRRREGAGKAYRYYGRRAS